MTTTTISEKEIAFQQERAKMYGDLFLKNDFLRGFQNTEVIRGAEALKSAVNLKKTADHKIILAYTSNMISSGLRECISSLIAGGAVDAIVTTAGGIEEDLIKCLGPTLIGDFTLEGNALRDKGLNRIGNLLVPNNNYVLFESFFRTVLHQHLKAQKASNCAPQHCAPSDILKSSGEYLTKIELLVEQHYNMMRLKSSSNSSAGTPSAGNQQQQPAPPSSSSSSTSGIEEGADDGFGEHLADIDLAVLKQQLQYSVAYQCWKHNVPILCPAFTDGSMGDMSFFFNVSYPGLIVDPLLDIIKLDKLLEKSSSSTTSSSSVSVFSVGGGLPKHFAMRAASTAAMEQQRKFTSAVLITTTAPLTDGSVSAGTQQDDESQFYLTESEENKPEIIHVRVEATLCFPFMCAMALF